MQYKKNVATDNTTYSSPTLYHQDFTYNSNDELSHSMLTITSITITNSKGLTCIVN